MRNRKLLSAILPSDSDYKSILDDLRQKYNIPILLEPDAELGEFLHSDTGIPWDLIHSDLKRRIRDTDDLWPESILELSKTFKDNLSTEANLERFAEEYDPSPEEIIQVTK